MSIVGKQIALISCPETPDEIRDHLDAYVEAVTNLRHESFLPYLENRLLPVVNQRLENAQLRMSDPMEEKELNILHLRLHQIEVVGARDEEKETELAWILPLITEQDFTGVLGEAFMISLSDEILSYLEERLEEGDELDGEDEHLEKYTVAIRHHLWPYLYAFYELAKTGVMVGLAFDPAEDKDGQPLQLEGNGLTDGFPAIWVYSPLERLYYVYDVVMTIRG